MPDSGRVTGRVVYSVAGRDGKRPFIVIGVTDDGRALIADGKLHTLEKPKKKNLAHLRITDGEIATDGLTNEKLRESLRSFETAR